jgi:hypothetical protein
MTAPIVNYFDEIYEAAKSKNEVALKELIEAGACIDEVSSNSRHGSAVTRLAFENNRAAVELLLIYGASIDHAVMGAAQGGHIAFINDLRSKGAAIRMAARGAAKGVQREYLLDLIAKNSNTLIDFLSLLSAAAESNDMKFTAELVRIARKRELSMPLNKITGRVAYGAAKSGHICFAEDLIRMNADINHVVRGAAQHGGSYFVIALLRRGASVHFAGAGAGIGGHVDLANYLIKLGATTTNVGRSAAMGGHVRFVEDLVERGADIDEVIKGATAGRHHALVKRLQELKVLKEQHAEHTVTQSSTVTQPEGQETSLLDIYNSHQSVITSLPSYSTLSKSSLFSSQNNSAEQSTIALGLATDDDIRGMLIAAHCRQLLDTIVRETTWRLQELNFLHQFLGFAPVGFSLRPLPSVAPSQVSLLDSPALSPASSSSSVPSGASASFHPASDSTGRDNVSFTSSSKRERQTTSNDLIGDNANAKRHRR